MLKLKAGWVRWAPVRNVLNGVITYGNLEEPGGAIEINDEPEEDIAKLAANNNASYYSIPYYKGTTLTMTLGDEDLDKISTATRLRDLGDGLYGLDPDKIPDSVGVAYIAAMIKPYSSKIAKYRVKYYPMVSFKMPESSAKTAGEEIEIEPIEIEGDVLTADGNLPYYMKDFETEAEAVAFAEGRLGRQINLQLHLGDGHVENNGEQHELNRQNVPVGRQIAANAIAEGLGRIVPPEGMHFLGWALEQGGQVVQFINPGLGLGMNVISQSCYAVYERNVEENQNENQNPNENQDNPNEG